MTDQELRQNVIDELNFEPSVNAAHIGVAADDGVVTLSGHVSSYAEKVAAEQAVRRPNHKQTADDEIAQRCARASESKPIARPKHKTRYKELEPI
jgi:hypothetical protein